MQEIDTCSKHTIPTGRSVATTDEKGTRYNKEVLYGHHNWLPYRTEEYKSIYKNHRNVYKVTNVYCTYCLEIRSIHQDA